MDQQQLAQIKALLLSMNTLHLNKEKALTNYIHFQNIKVEESTKAIKRQREAAREARREADAHCQHWEALASRIQEMKAELEQARKQRTQQEESLRQTVLEREQENKALRKSILEKENELQHLRAQQSIEIQKIREEAVSGQDRQAQLNTVLSEKGVLIEELSQQLQQQQHKNLELQQAQQDSLAQAKSLQHSLAQAQGELQGTREQLGRVEQQRDALVDLVTRYSPLMLQGLDTLVGGHANTLSSLDSLANEAQKQLSSLDQALSAQ